MRKLKIFLKRSRSDLCRGQKHVKGIRAHDITMIWSFTECKWLQALWGFMLFQYIACDCLLPELDFPDGEVILPPFVDENQTIAEELSTLRFKCLDGYLRIGPEYIQCVDEEWTDEVPYCADTRCHYPPIIENATYVIKSGAIAALMVGSSTVYKCTGDHELNNTGASTLRCGLRPESRTAEWVGEMPVCREKNSCPDPGVSPHGSRRGTEEKCCLSGETLRFYCHRGYELVGEREMRCLRSGIWSSERPLCRPLDNYCELPAPIPHGIVTGDKEGDYFVPEDEAMLVCEPGYKCRGKMFVVCGEGGVWEDEFGVCKEILCDPPPPLEHGVIPELQTTNLTIFPYDFEITYVCDEGYRLNGGDSWRTCGKKGWSGKTPHCEVIKCPDPDIPDNGHRVGYNYTVGSTVRFGCNRGYELLGSVQRHCKPNGQWTGELSRCNIPSNYCPDPGTPIKGSKNMTEYKMWDKVRFRCQGGYMLLGSEVRECLPDKTWSGTETFCKGRCDYDDPAEVRDILMVKLAEKVEEQKKEQQKYEEALHSSFGNGSFPQGRILDLNFPARIILYFAFDVSGSVGPHNFAKNIEFAKAIVRKVGISVNGARAGALTFSSKAEGMFLPLNYDSTDDVVDALDRIEYNGGGTAASSALHLIRMEYMPLVKQWLGDANIKSVVFILTDGKANMAGDPKKEADKLKKEGVEIFCIGITCDVKMKSLYDIASSSEYENGVVRPNVFILQNYATLSWITQQITNGTIDYSQCGLGVKSHLNRGRRMFRVSKTKKLWPWIAALYMTVGNDDPPRRELKCGGSIIHRRFILTAAHCMYKEPVQMRDRSEIRVKLGLTHVRNEEHLQEFEVQKIYTHPQYHRKKTFDYDIALLELKKPIEYNEFVRPVCLPPKELPDNSEFYKPGSLIWATGWGHASRLKKNSPTLPKVYDDLMEAYLRVQNRERCLESIKDDNLNETHFTERMFCAGTGEGRNDTCKGDSGGPLMHSHVNAEGYLCWTQVGIVSWGLGCAEKNEFGFYTHLQKLMPWVDETIENALKRME